MNQFLMKWNNYRYIQYFGVELIIWQGYSLAELPFEQIIDYIEYCHVLTVILSPISVALEHGGWFEESRASLECAGHAWENLLLSMFFVDAAPAIVERNSMVYWLSVDVCGARTTSPTKEKALLRKKALPALIRSHPLLWVNSLLHTNKIDKKCMG